MTSRKLITCLFVSMVMRSPLLLKMRHISFLIFSVSLGVALVMVLQLGEEKVSHEFACFGAVVASHCHVECCVIFFAWVGDCGLGWSF